MTFYGAAVRVDPRPGARPLRRPGRDRGLPRRRRLFDTRSPTSRNATRPERRDFAAFIEAHPHRPDRGRPRRVRRELETGARPPAVSVARMFYDRVAASPAPRPSASPPTAGGSRSPGRRPAETVKRWRRACWPWGSSPRSGSPSRPHAHRVAVRRPRDHLRGRGDDRRLPHDRRRGRRYILADSGTRIAFAEDDVQVAKLRLSATTCRTWSG